MKKIIIAISILLLVLSGLLFYWYEWRPSQIRKECDKCAYEDSNGKFEKSQSRLFGSSPIYDDLYKKCLREKGL